VLDATEAGIILRGLIIGEQMLKEMDWILNQLDQTEVIQHRQPEKRVPYSPTLVSRTFSHIGVNIDSQPNGEAAWKQCF